MQSKGHCLGGMTADKEHYSWQLKAVAIPFSVGFSSNRLPLSFGTVCSYMVEFKNGENEKDVFPNEGQE